ncbi:MAG: hypothetical protein JO353_10290, partial [Phycisphaerae bacterium]|nr:hypothetical protein [Phycisphaerae bacterium]
MKSPKKNVRPIRQHLETLVSRCLLSASDIIVTPSLVVSAAASSSNSISGYTPAQIKSAYGISSISLNGVTGDGSGQTIAIVDAYSDPNIASDLAVFDKQFGLSAPASFKQVSQAGSTSKLPAQNADWDSEISLDVEWAHAIAPKANIVLVDATSDSINNLMAAVKYASSISTVSVISMSWGTGEFSGESAYDSYFTTPSGHIGITYVAASGDEGAAGGPEYPASSPNVLSVGGTTLSISSTGSVTNESAWSDSSGGTSSYEKASTAQSSATGTTNRQTPDVSYDANPNTGFAVYDSVPDYGYVGWQEVGGTSAGAPQWVALVAIADQARVAKGSATLDGATGTLPAIYSIYSNSSSYAADFSDITSGSSVLSGGGFGYGGYGGYGFGGGGRFGRGPRAVQTVSATAGYDTLTGVGTPKAAALINALASAKVSTSVKAATSKTTSSRVKSTLRAAAAEVVEEQPVSASFVSIKQNASSIPAATPFIPESTAITATPPIAVERAHNYIVNSSTSLLSIDETTIVTNSMPLFAVADRQVQFSRDTTLRRSAEVITSERSAPLLSTIASAPALAPQLSAA